MSQLTIAFNLARVDIRWRFLQIFYVGMALAGLIIFLLSSHFKVSTSPQLITFELFFLTPAFAHLINIPRIGFSYQLGLPISPRTLFLTTLLLTGCAIWIPAALVTAFLLASGHHRLTSPVVLVASWMCASCALWLGWPQRQSAPGSARAIAFLIQVAFLISWFLHRIPQQVAAAIFFISAGTILVVFLRLPSAFTLDSHPASLKLWTNSNPWFTLLRILFPPATLLIVLTGLLQQGGYWPLHGFWIFMFYTTIRSGDPLLLGLPLSQLQLMYARLACAFLLETSLASYCDPFGRLARTHSGAHLVPTLLAVAVALTLVAVMKCLLWRRAPRWAKRPLLVLFCVLLIGTFVLSFVGNIMNQMASLPPLIVIPSTSAVSVLLLWLIAVQTGNSDHFGMSVTNPSVSTILARA